MRIEVALGRIAELQTELDRVKGLAAYLSEDEIRADERHKIIEEIEQLCRTRAKYLLK